MQTPFFRRATGAIALVAVCGLTACVTQPQQPYQQPYPAPGYQNQGYNNQGYNNQNNAPYGTEYGRVVNIQALQGQNNTSGAGAVLGAVVGGVLGNQVGKGSGREAATAMGAVGGAVVGNMVEGSNSSSQAQGYRISIQLDQGGSRAYDVSTPGDIRVGDRVRLNNGQISRQ